MWHLCPHALSVIFSSSTTPQHSCHCAHMPLCTCNEPPSFSCGQKKKKTKKSSRNSTLLVTPAFSYWNSSAETPWFKPTWKSSRYLCLCTDLYLEYTLTIRCHTLPTMLQTDLVKVNTLLDHKWDIIAFINLDSQVDCVSLFYDLAMSDFLISIYLFI